MYNVYYLSQMSNYYYYYYYYKTLEKQFGCIKWIGHNEMEYSVTQRSVSKCHSQLMRHERRCYRYKHVTST